MQDTIDTAAPIEAGIPADSIHRFLDRLDAHQLNMHSILLMRHNRLVAEGYYAPCRADSLHRMFSICKTMNALAIGLLQSEGKLKLSDPIITYFPDKVQEPVHPWISAMTIRDLLMMRTCHASTTYKTAPDMEWVESFFTVPPSHKPGTVFHYDTSAAHVLCVLVERLTGMRMLDYLRVKALDRIGWSKDAYVLINDYGDSQGGSGLMATSRDLLLLGKLLMQNGNWEGEQLIPADYVQEMTGLLTPNALTSGVISETQGYGYQIWRTQKDGFVCYGMGGQLVICLPKEDMILVTTADTQGCGGGNDLIYDSFYEEILPVLDTHPKSDIEEAASAKRLSERLKALRLTPLKTWRRTLPEVSSCTSFLDERTFGATVSGKTFYLAENPQGFSDITLSFSDSSGIFRYTWQGKEAEIIFGLEECIPGVIPFYEMKCAASGVWLAKDTFYIKVHILDVSVGSLHMEFVFGEKDVTVFFKKIEETMFKEFSGHFYGRI